MSIFLVTLFLRLLLKRSAEIVLSVFQVRISPPPRVVFVLCHVTKNENKHALLSTILTSCLCYMVSKRAGKSSPN